MTLSIDLDVARDAVRRLGEQAAMAGSWSSEMAGVASDVAFWDGIGEQIRLLSEIERELADASTLLAATVRAAGIADTFDVGAPGESLRTIEADLIASLDDDLGSQGDRDDVERLRDLGTSWLPPFGPPAPSRAGTPSSDDPSGAEDDCWILCSGEKVLLPYESAPTDGANYIMQVVVLGQPKVGSTQVHDASESMIDVGGFGGRTGTTGRSIDFDSAVVLVVASDTANGRFTSKVVDAWRGSVEVSEHRRFTELTYSLDATGPDGDGAGTFAIPLGERADRLEYSDVRLVEGERVELPGGGVVWPLDNMPLLNGELPEELDGLVVSKVGPR